MQELVPSFKQTIFDNSIDAMLEIAEMGIDSILENEAIKEIPFFKTLYGIGAVILGIYERNLARQTIEFLRGFRAKSISADKLEAYKNKMKDEKFAEAESGRVLVLINKNVDEIKSQFDGRFYAAYINEEINWNEFCELTDINERLFVSDLDVLAFAYNGKEIEMHSDISYRHDRLVSCGLIMNEVRLGGGFIAEDLESEEMQNLLNLTKIGKTFCKYAFE